MSASQTVSEVVDAERRRRGLSQMGLAMVLGVNQAWVSRKLSGARGWTLEDLDLLSERMELPLPVLLMTPVVGSATQRWRTLLRWVTRRYHTSIWFVSHV